MVFSLFPLILLHHTPGHFKLLKYDSCPILLKVLHEMREMMIFNGCILVHIFLISLQCLVPLTSLPLDYFYSLVSMRVHPYVCFALLWFFFVSVMDLSTLPLPKNILISKILPSFSFLMSWLTPSAITQMNHKCTLDLYFKLPAKPSIWIFQRTSN